MAKNLKNLDPVQGLIDYVNDIKPYHSKIIEALVEYVGNEFIDITLIEKFLLNIDIDFSYDFSKKPCDSGGFSTSLYDDPDVLVISSPDPSKTLVDFPAINGNTDSFIVLGDQRKIFEPTYNLNFSIVSFVEEKIIDSNESVLGSPIGSPLATGGFFVVNGDKTSFYNTGDIFAVVGSYYNDGIYKITNVYTYGSPVKTVLEVDGQIVKSNSTNGFIKTFSSYNIGNFTPIGTEYFESTSTNSDYTLVYISGVDLVTPTIIDPINQRYVSLVSVGPIDFSYALGYSNILKYYSGTSSLHQFSDEGLQTLPIISVDNSLPNPYFSVYGRFDSSNISINDIFYVIGSTENDNNGNPYTIRAITTYLDSDNNYVTNFYVNNINSNVVDGYIKIYIPSNVFVLNGNYIEFFKQGTKVKVFGGTLDGIYTTLNSIFWNNKTYVRVSEDIFEYGNGNLIVDTTNDTLYISGDFSNYYKVNDKINIINSVYNDGFYTITSVGILASPTDLTAITLDRQITPNDKSGEIYKFINGKMTYVPRGFGETSELCEFVPETIVSVFIKENLNINGIPIQLQDNIIVYGKTVGSWGYDLPESTIFSPTSPQIEISDIPPSTPNEMDLWFDTSLNFGSPSQPGILKQYRNIGGSPAIFVWNEISSNKAYWIDTTKNYVYFRLIYQHYDNTSNSYTSPIDTGWILEYKKIPGYNEFINADKNLVEDKYESFFVNENPVGVPNNNFELRYFSFPGIGSPFIADKNYIKISVNGTPSEFTITSQTTFSIISPQLRIGDFVEVKILKDNTDISNVFVGAYDTNAAIEENFDLLLGYKFYIVGTEQTLSSPTQYKIYLNDNQNGDVYNIFMQGSPKTLVDNKFRIIGSSGSPNIDGVYTILSVTKIGSPSNYVILEVAEPLTNSGIFSGSPLIESGIGIYQEWFQYVIVNTNTNSIFVHGDATTNITNGIQIKIVHSNGSPNNNGIYTVSASPTFDGRNTRIDVLETIPITGNSGGWVESI